MILALGVVMVAAGLALLLDLGGAGDVVIRRVTSRNLGDLAPGFAASRAGFRVYAVLLVAVGLMVTGVGAATLWVAGGLVSIAVGGLGFVVGSVVAVAGEVRTYRRLSRR